MKLPVQTKPDVDMSFEQSVLIVPNVINKELAKVLLDFAIDTTSSGLHRRGSKNPHRCKASFDTCLVFNTTHEVYTILDPIWEQYINKFKPTLTFIEPYEIKIYSIGDGFGYHQDGYNNLNYDFDRKINMIVQLSDEESYEGGTLMIGDYKAPKEFGTAIMFPSQHSHCVTPITKGTRVSLIGHAWGPFIK